MRSIYSLFHSEMFYYLMDTISCCISTHSDNSQRASDGSLADFRNTPTDSVLINFDVLCLTGRWWRTPEYIVILYNHLKICVLNARWSNLYFPVQDPPFFFFNKTSQFTKMKVCQGTVISDSSLGENCSWFASTSFSPDHLHIFRNQSAYLKR